MALRIQRPRQTLRNIPIHMFQDRLIKLEAVPLRPESLESSCIFRVYSEYMALRNSLSLQLYVLVEGRLINPEGRLPLRGHSKMGNTDNNNEKKQHKRCTARHKSKLAWQSWRAPVQTSTPTPTSSSLTSYTQVKTHAPGRHFDALQFTG